jgi:single-stranded-DNA-specific exonuclease
MQIKIKQRETGPDIIWPEDLHPVLKRIYSSRNITSPEELDYSLSRLCSYESMGNIKQAACLMADHMERNSYVLVVADYDADGATACALGLRGLTAMGCSQVEYLVPDRFTQGYGLSPAVVEQALHLNPDVIITVDNGISSIDGVALARRNGIDVIITDHHLPGKELPDATAIVNPNLHGDAFPSKSIAGVGVMFYFLAALRAELRNRNWFESREIPEPNLAMYMDLVALGTVADVVPLDYNNRIMVSYGIDLIRSGKGIPGIRALLQVAGKHFRNIVASDLGFVAGPRLNAAGRLTDMSLGIECLLADEEASQDMASELDKLNSDRKSIQDEMQQQAMQALTGLKLDNGVENLHGLCLYNSDWHQGVIGIVASKIKDKMQRPVIAFARDEDGVLKGSARSVKGIHIRDVIDRVATQEPGIIITYGGHAMAAGMTLHESTYEKFSELFNLEIKHHIDLFGINSDIYSDGILNAEFITMELAELIRSGGPWGQGFPEPVFEGMFEIIDKRIVGENHLKLKIKPSDQDKLIDAIAFNTTHRGWPKDTTGISVIYRLDINEYMGRRSPQLIVEHLEPLQ